MSQMARGGTRRFRIRAPLARAWLALVCLLLVVVPPAQSSADEVAVPFELQVELLAKVAVYDKNLPARAGDRVRTLVLTKPSDTGSTRASTQLQKALVAKDTIVNLPHDPQPFTWTDAATLAKQCKARRIAIVYLTPGFSDEEIANIARALDGVDVLTVSAVASFVPRGIVLGFDLVSGKPKLLVHLPQARRQRVALSADVLKLMKVYE
jgi:hypothetical protein